ncbi:MAG: hypothetical protein B7Y41_15530 [Hydrogenophilales bacterium 28-61-23]|nr:MAG: hypothetical protein B7Y41_15530 [Hydrogenophilales bacterium 28-61-23]
MLTNQVLSHLKKHGIALPLVRKSLAALTMRGEISQCSVTHFNDNKRVDAFQCRISGYVPPVAAGRKAGSNKSASAD